MTDVSFYRNMCPHCESFDVTLVDVELSDGETEKKAECRKCGKIIELSELTKVKVGRTSKL